MPNFLRQEKLKFGHESPDPQIETHRIDFTPPIADIGGNMIHVPSITNHENVTFNTDVLWIGDNF